MEYVFFVFGAGVLNFVVLGSAIALIVWIVNGGGE